MIKPIHVSMNTLENRCSKDEEKVHPWARFPVFPRQTETNWDLTGIQLGFNLDPLGISGNSVAPYCRARVVLSEGVLRYCAERTKAGALTGQRSRIVK